MSVAEMQACLARLYTQDAYRKLFLVAPDLSLEGYRLDTQEREAIKGLDRDRLERFAAQLKAKRLAKLRTAYPLLYRFGEDAAERYTDRFFALHLVQPRQPFLQEVVAFGQFMESTLSADVSLPPYLPDIARYERLHYVARFRAIPFGLRLVGSHHPTRVTLQPSSRPFVLPTVQVGRFRYDVPRFAGALRDGAVPPELQPGDYAHVFQRVRHAEPRVFAVNGATRLLLSLCDGRRDVTELAGTMERHLAQPEVVDEVAEILEHLVELRVVGVLGEDRHAS